MRASVRLMIVSAILLSPASLFAGVIYNYVGTPFTYCYGPAPCDPVGNVTASLTMSAPLAANRSWGDLWPELVDFSVSDGKSTLSMGDYQDFQDLQAHVWMAVSTDSTGAINKWGISVTGPQNEYVIGIHAASDLEIGANRWDNVFYWNQGGYPVGYAEASGPGTWQQVPEPELMFLLYIGLGAVCLVGGRRRK